MNFREFRYKNIDFEAVKDVDPKKRIVTGYFAAFNNKDSDGDVILQTAFNKTLTERGVESGRSRIMHLWQHDSRQVLAKPYVLKADDYGLYFESKFPDTSLANDVLKLYQDGIINEHSIGYQVIQSEYDKNIDANVLKEVKLWEGSTVTWGANEFTPFIGLKSSGLLTNDLREMLETFYKQIKRLDLSEKTHNEIELTFNQLISLCEPKAANDSTLKSKMGDRNNLAKTVISNLLLKKVNEKLNNNGK